jgi:3'(2'), 5'-bisphosphate nucleotidase
MPIDVAITALDYKNLLNDVRQIAYDAGQEIMAVYASNDFDIAHKEDKTPLTRADIAAHNSIVAGLQQLTPQLPILSEESSHIDFSQRSQWQRYWLVDPLDGTREFIKRNGEFTVNIALINKHKPILGVIYVPVTQDCYYAAVGVGAFKMENNAQPLTISVRHQVQNQLTIAGSRSHAGKKLQQFADGFDMKVEVVSVGSSLKSCLVAEGKADVYPRFGPTSEWDTAAAQCIVEQAGGKLTDMQLQPLRYNTKSSLLNPYFIVFGDKTRNWSQHLAQILSTEKQ